jgi:DNA polymerase-3 subunit alpha
MKQLTSMDIQKVHQIDGRGKRDLTLAGLFTTKKAFISKKGDKMAFATLEDLEGKIECIIFPRTYGEYANMLETDEPIVVTGTVNLDEDPRKFFPTKIQLLKEQAEEKVSGVRISIPEERVNPYTFSKLKKILLSYRGSVPTHVIYQNNTGRVRIPLGEEFLVNPTPQMASQINEIFQENSVSFIVDGKLEQVSSQT